MLFDVISGPSSAGCTHTASTTSTSHGMTLLTLDRVIIGVTAHSHASAGTSLNTPRKKNAARPESRSGSPEINHAASPVR